MVVPPTVASARVRPDTSDAESESVREAPAAVSAGAERLTAGAVLSNVGVAVADPSFPARSLAIAGSVFTPSVSATPGRENERPLTRAGTPFTVTERTGSFTVPRTVTGEAFTRPETGDVMITTGEDVSRVTRTVARELLPAGSTAFTWMLLIPSVRSAWPENDWLPETVGALLIEISAGSLRSEERRVGK